MEQGFSSLFAVSVMKHTENKSTKNCSYSLWKTTIVQCCTENNKTATLKSESTVNEQARSYWGWSDMIWLTYAGIMTGNII